MKILMLRLDDDDCFVYLKKDSYIIDEYELLNLMRRPHLEEYDIRVFEYSWALSRKIKLTYSLEDIEKYFLTLYNCNIIPKEEREKYFNILFENAIPIDEI